MKTGGVATLVYGQGEWRQAAAEVLRLARSWPDSPGRARQPLIVACGHSLGANSVGHLARLLDQSELVAAAPDRTTLLGSYLLKPRGEAPKATPRPFRRLLFEQHYLLAHDARVHGYVCGAVRILLRLSAEGANLQGRSESLR
jgi:hypothetical protein